MSEDERYQFVLGRDGPIAALVWARQTLAIYEAAALRESKHWDSIQDLRRIVGWQPPASTDSKP